MLTTTQMERSQYAPVRTVHREAGVVLTPEKIETFLSFLRDRGRVEGTLEWYRRGLNHLYASLPDEKLIRRNTLNEWKEKLLGEGYAPRTINTFLVAADGYLEEAGARDGTPMSRTNVSTGIRQLCVAAQISPEKGNPRCLKRLYQSTRADIEASIALLVEQTLERKLEEEQLSIGWEDSYGGY